MGIGKVTRMGVAAAVLLLLTTPIADADNGDPVVLGQTNSSTSATFVNVDTDPVNWQEGGPPPAQGFVVDSLYAIKRTDLIQFDDGAAVEAYGSDGAVNAVGLDYGVRALALADDSIGVIAQGDTGLIATGGVALEASGEVTFSTAGLAIIPEGASSVVVKGGRVDIGPNTKVLVTPQSGGGTVQRVGRNFTRDTFQIVLTQPATQKMTVAYFLIS
jgi:hypothetical protein